MSYQIGMDTIRLKPTERPAHTEYCSSDPLVRAVTGLDPLHDSRAWQEFYEAWQFDFLWLTDDGPISWSECGRTTDMGHGEFLEDGRDMRSAQPCPFGSVEEAWEFNAAEEYGLPDFDELVDYYSRRHQSTQALNPEQVCPGGYYRTLLSGAIAAFGWEMLLQAAADQDRFERVLEGIFQLSLHHYKAWAETSIEVFICHDDMVWSEGPFMHPDFYRRAIIPRYKELWSVLKSAGKIVLYTADGDYTDFLYDLAEAGADGFCFEPRMDLEVVVRRFGDTHVIMGSQVDCRTLTFGATDQIRAEVDSSLEVAAGCPGFVFAIGNHIPSNVPVDSALYYFDYLSRNWHR
ncbi:MAG: uroporphyrinogen decarboxylase family protein [Planctomycetota bacterium]